MSQCPISCARSVFPLLWCLILLLSFLECSDACPVHKTTPMCLLSVCNTQHITSSFSFVYCLQYKTMKTVGLSDDELHFASLSNHFQGSFFLYMHCCVCIKSDWLRKVFFSVFGSPPSIQSVHCILQLQCIANNVCTYLPVSHQYHR